MTWSAPGDLGARRFGLAGAAFVRTCITAGTVAIRTGQPSLLGPQPRRTVRGPRGGRRVSAWSYRSRSSVELEASWNGTLVTMTPGSNSSRPLIRSALWLCRRCSHHRPTTYSGMNMVTTSRGEFRRRRLHEIHDRPSDFPVRRLDDRQRHPDVVAVPLAWILRVSVSSTFTVSPVMVSGRVACAYATARSVGLCTLDTSTIAWLRAGSTGSPSAGSSSWETGRSGGGCPA